MHNTLNLSLGTENKSDGCKGVNMKTSGENRRRCIYNAGINSKQCFIRHKFQIEAYL